MNNHLIYGLPPFLAGIFILILGYFIYQDNKTLARNRAISIMCLGASIWLCCYAVNYLIPNNERLNIFLSRFSYLGVTTIWVSYLHFTVEFLHLKAKKILILTYIFAFVTGGLALFTDLVVVDNYHYFWGPYPKAGILHPLCLIYALYVWIYCITQLFKAYQNKHNLYSSIEVNRIKYVFWSYFIANSAAIDYIQNYGFEFYPFGFINISTFVFIMTYAILRHQLLDIEVVIKKTLVFAGLFASVFAMLVLPTLIIQEYLLRGAGQTARLIGLTISGIVIILTMRRIETFLINVTDKYLFQKRYDYKELLKTFTSEVLTVLNLDELVNLTVNKLEETIKLKSSAVLLFDDEKQQFNVVASYNIKDPSVTLVRPDGIVTFMDQTHGYILIKELHQKKITIPISIQEIIDKLNAELIIPMVMHEEVISVLSLGKKKSDEDYTDDDLDILLPLARTLAIAISNAQLFDELGKTQAEAAQREKMAVIGTLSAGINHEICNPLGIARGQCEAFLLNIKDGLYKDKTQQDLLNKAMEIMTLVMKQSDRATSITKKLSTFAKPSKGEMEIVDVEKEVDETVGLVGYELKLEKIEIEKKIDGALPKIFVDKKQFEEVLFNLIRNAGQSIGEKGKVTVAAREERGRVIIDIQDTGSGIPPDKVNQLFNPFFTTKDPGKGTGLGLFIVRQVVEKNEGRIYLKETKVDEGTTFTVEFPAMVSERAKVSKV